MAQKLKVNDEVKIISGDNKGKTAKITKIDFKLRKAYLEGIGVVERHMRKSYLNPTGGKKTVHLGIDFSNLKLIKSFEFVKKDAKDKKSAKKIKKGAK